MNNFWIELQAKLDEAKSKGNINNDIDKLQSQVDKLKIRAELDPNTAQKLVKDIAKVINQKITISNVDVDVNSATKAGQDYGKQFSQGVTQGLKNNDSALNSFKKSLENIGMGSKEIDNIANKIKNLGVQIETLNQSQSAGKKDILSVNISGIDKYGQAIKLTQQYNSATGELVKTINNVSTVQQKAGTTVNNFAKQQSQAIKNIIDAIGRGDYDKKLSDLENSYKRLGLSSYEIKEKTHDASLALDNLKKKNLDSLVQDENEFTNALKKSKNEAGILRTELDKIYNPKRQTKLTTDIQNWLSRNSRASSEAKQKLKEYYQELSGGRVPVDRLEYINRELREIDAQQRGLGKIGKNLKDQLSDAGKELTQWLSVRSGIMFLTSKAKNAVGEIKELENILTEIDKTSNRTSQELKQLGMDAYDAASKYGRTATDYLVGVQEMNRSGFYGEKGNGMAEQSLLAQSAGDMDAELANKYVLSLNAAYKYNGEVEKINAALDGQNSITNRNSVAMENMAAAMTKAGTVAAGYRVKIEDLSAMAGTMESVTKSGGDEVGNAIKAILINLQNVTSDKIAMTLDKANASMTEMVNGTKKLREPISILRDLAKTFNQLDEDDPLRAEILTNIGQKYHANKLGALLQNMDMFDKMLVDYSEGGGSALEESNKSAENLTGTINKLHNTWTEFVNSVVNADELKGGVSALDGIISVAQKAIDTFGVFPTVVSAAYAAISKSGGLMRLNPIIDNSPFLATVEFSSDAYDSYAHA